MEKELKPDSLMSLDLESITIPVSFTRTNRFLILECESLNTVMGRLSNYSLIATKLT